MSAPHDPVMGARSRAGMQVHPGPDTSAEPAGMRATPLTGDVPRDQPHDHEEDRESNEKLEHTSVVCPPTPTANDLYAPLAVGRQIVARLSRRLNPCTPPYLSTAGSSNGSTRRSRCRATTGSGCELPHRRGQLALLSRGRRISPTWSDRINRRALPSSKAWWPAPSPTLGRRACRRRLRRRRFTERGWGCRMVPELGTMRL